MNGNAQKVVATVMLAMLGWLIADQRTLRSYVRPEISAVRGDMADLRERMVRLEGRVDTLVDVIVRERDQ